jgi:hypothetical protein
MADPRYSELLGIDAAIENPDYFQLLSLESSAQFEEETVEVAYKEAIARLQKVTSPKHKEFVEFLKGEVKTARRTLGNTKTRGEYERELRNKRVDEFRKMFEKVTRDHILSAIDEIGVIKDATRLGLARTEAKALLESMCEERKIERVKTRIAPTVVQDAAGQREDMQFLSAVELVLDGLIVRKHASMPEYVVGLPDSRYTIGSDDECDLVLRSSEVKPMHAMLKIQNDVATITAENLNTHVLVNGNRVSDAVLSDGDVIQVGPSILKFRSKYVRLRGFQRVK